MTGPVTQTVGERFWAKVAEGPGQYAELPCWEWTASLTLAGYAQFWTGTRQQMGHRFAYEEMIGAIPPGLELDHLCRVRSCVNPYHLEPVTRQVNLSRGLGCARTACPQGHAYDTKNTWVGQGRFAGMRLCRTCDRDGHAARRAARREEALCAGS